MAAQSYIHAWEHYKDELILLDKKLELLYKRRQKLTPDPQTDSFRGMFVSEDEFIRLIGEQGWDADPQGEEPALLEDIQEMETYIAKRVEESRKKNVFLPLSYVTSVFGLSAIEERFVMLGLAVELDRKYERIFGFLQDDLTSKTPVISLALQVACSHPEDMRAARTTFMVPEGRLARYLLQREEQEIRGQSLLSKPLVLDKRIVTFLLDSGEMDPKLKPAVEMVYPDEELAPLLVQEDFQQRLRGFIREAQQAPEAERKRLAFHLWGNPGAGKKLQVKHFSSYFNKPLLIANLADVLLHAASFEEQVSAIVREAILHQAVLCFTRLEALYPEEPDLAAQQRLGRFHELLGGYGGMVFLLAGKFARLNWKPKERLILEHELQVPDEGGRERLWAAFARELGVSAGVDFRVMSGKFRFTPGQIHRALTLARGYSAWQREPQAAALESLNTAALYKACYQQVQHKLERKATRIEPRYQWGDIILPPEQKDQLRNACNQVKYRGVVYSDWGFEKKLAYGKGLSMLFAGPPGTGKTMSAQVVAGDLQLELYKVDLSQVISKYIGETEKNLHEIFEEAQLSNAVLFFDETDALFGKRSEVKDSHDKYANIETAYLLQKMEEYQGITVLATNLLNNIDEAFLRRINYVIKFPFPDSEYREKIWQSMFPPAAPLSDDVDFRYLAQRYEIAGGNIKNVVLSSAFLAAEAGEPIRMQHIIKSIRHELQKSGKILARQEWEDY
ncbi:ATP-binding protein [Paenibacillus aceris]|uniref:SpoVK/Ycf46/Vps4 family AAA+-type ATPase n=1 Tax=Paenibacillus aceris TaxID=869555 RepID=A0ABS4I5Z8_9BACL|nr:AAA family ATPase [Paenibacillus aceris]MBP1966342.1 SpoVK/Ycf46/Vps4 family AAA+-type ATPase [Paenibacillus aceris]NHW38600.1 ATP-binding protein [Paenibacillus aceris]